MVTTVWIEVSFAAAHLLPRMPEEHKCRRLHGHTWRVRLEVTGPVASNGFVVDYAAVRANWQSLHDELDHRYMNEIPGLENPTTENLGAWILRRMPSLSAVEIREGDSHGVTVRR